MGHPGRQRYQLWLLAEKDPFSLQAIWSRKISGLIENAPQRLIEDCSALNYHFAKFSRSADVEIFERVITPLAVSVMQNWRYTGAKI